MSAAGQAGLIRAQDIRDKPINNREAPPGHWPGGALNGAGDLSPALTLSGLVLVLASVWIRAAAHLWHVVYKLTSGTKYDCAVAPRSGWIDEEMDRLAAFAQPSRQFFRPETPAFIGDSDAGEVFKRGLCGRRHECFKG